MELVFIFCNPLLHNIIQVNCLTSSAYASVKVISLKKKKMTPHLTLYAELGASQFSGIRASRIRFGPANRVGSEKGRHSSTHP